MMASVKHFLGKWGLHSLLLPVFFVLHNYLQYYGLVSVAVALKVFAFIAGLVLFFILMLFLITRNVSKALQLTTMLSFVVMFYGVIKDFLSKTAGLPFLASYKIMLPVMLVLTVFLFRIICRKKDFSRINLFQNVLLLVLIVIDGVATVSGQSRSFASRNLLVKQDILNIDDIATPADRPDVYYLVFDCYPSTSFLRTYMQFDNTTLDTALQKRGFRVINKTRSNYNRTAFSMASALNFGHLTNIYNYSKISAKNYAEARLTIDQAVVPRVFSHVGYKTYNLSVFEIGGTKPLYLENFLTLPEHRVLLYNTLIERFRTDILWNFITGRHKVGAIERMFSQSQSEIRKQYADKKVFNEKIADSLQIISTIKRGVPKFVYAHFYLPHPPFFYNEKGEPNNFEYVITEESLTDKKLFLSYLQYTNHVMLQLVDSIFANSPARPLIVIQSDHGFRDFRGGADAPHLFFRNYAAYYFPDQNYNKLYDTLSNVNTFPIIFNKYFKTSIPMQKDTSTFLPY